jgi:hypothetical protein
MPSGSRWRCFQAEVPRPTFKSTCAYKGLPVPSAARHRRAGDGVDPVAARGSPHQAIDVGAPWAEYGRCAGLGPRRTIGRTREDQDPPLEPA